MDQEIQFTTADDLTLAMTSLPSRLEGGAHGSVVLMHGMAVNRNLLDFPGHSVARYLRDEGYDVFVPELRGNGRSEMPEDGWDFADHLDFDMPAIIQTVKKHSEPDKPIHWVGHSMGGLMLMAYAIDHPRNCELSRSVVIGAGLDYRLGGDSWFSHLLPVIGLARLFPGTVLPWRRFLSLVSVAVGRAKNPIPSPLEDFYFNRDNVSPDIIRGYFERCGSPLPVRLLSQLSSLFSEGDLVVTGRYYRHRSRQAKLPLLFIGGTADKQCSADTVHGAAGLFNGAIFQGRGKAFGQAHDYGHIDLVLGENAQHEVWPQIADFLSES